MTTVIVISSPRAQLRKQFSTSGTEWESNSSFSAEQNLRGIVNILSVRSNLNIYNFFSSTRFNPYQPSIINFHLSPFIYIEIPTNATWASVVNPRMIPPLQHQPSQHEVYIHHLSFIPTSIIIFLSWSSVNSIWLRPREVVHRHRHISIPTFNGRYPSLPSNLVHTLVLTLFWSLTFLRTQRCLIPLLRCLRRLERLYQNHSLVPFFRCRLINQYVQFHRTKL